MSQLAINGGPKAIHTPIGKPWPVYGDEEREALNAVLESGKWWRGGYEKAEDSWVGKFENAFAEYQGAKYAVACTNGTQAIELALKAVGIRPGDEVICPASTFVATATAVILVNAIPIIVDIEPDYYQIDPDAIEAAIGPHTAGIIPVHYGGFPANMDRVMQIAEEHDLFVVEDCAHAHGSQWKGEGCGCIGDFGCFSLQMGKNLTCGEGGIVLSNDEDLAAMAYSYHHIGRMANRPFYEHHIVASNLRMTEWQGAIAYCGSQRLPEQNERRMVNFRHLEAGLREIPGVEPIEWDESIVTRRGCYFYHFKFNSEEFEGLPLAKFKEAMSAEGLSLGSGHLHPIQDNPLFVNRNFGPVCWPEGVRPPDYEAVETPVAQRILDEEGCSLSHATFLGDTSDMDLILDAIRKVRENVGELKQGDADDSS